MNILIFGYYRHLSLSELFSSYLASDKTKLAKMVQLNL